MISLIAPRQLQTLTGDKDAGSPADGVRLINSFQEYLYKLYGKDKNFRGRIYKSVGHEHTAEMWQETLSRLKKHL